MVLVAVHCPRCGNRARVPAASVPTATCNNAAGHHHPRGEHMIETATDEI